jgi:hypothetical protein
MDGHFENPVTVKNVFDTRITELGPFHTQEHNYTTL